ncbi:MAG: formylglycine-generating enzyme family protein [Planctomycetota bacterium]
MTWIPAGSFRMGNDAGFPDEAPAHEVALDGFWMDTHEVTNAQFAAFVAATGYRTIAERVPTPEDLPGVAPEDLVPGALVFHTVVDPERAGVQERWSFVPGACWRAPEGPGSSIDDRLNHPVVQVAWDDAVAYAAWAEKRLPTEAEWEYAARGGLAEKLYPWGDGWDRASQLGMNIWQGLFPVENTRADGFVRTAPVGRYAPNGYGLHDVAGNVWEWCSDWYDPAYYSASPRDNPPGPARPAFVEPGGYQRVMRGGSFLCTDQYCSGYRVSARMKSSPDTGLCHTGLRCVRSKR